MDQSDIKKVSVVMCTYNGEKYLREQIDSILNQTYPIYEIIIQDDCSTDESWEIIMEYATQNENLRIYQNNTNLGVCLNFFSASRKATGQYIAISDQDDIWYHDKIEVLIQNIKDKLLAISPSIIKEDDKIIQTDANRDIPIEKLIFGNIISGHQMMFRRDLLKYVQNIKVQIVPDYLIALIAYYFQSVVFIKEPLQIWRRHENSTTGHIRYNLKQRSGKQKVFITIINLFAGYKSIKIKEGFFKINHVLTLLDKEHPNGNSKLLIKLTKLLSEQSLLGYIKASFIVYRLRDCVFVTQVGLYFALSYLLRWWYDHQYDM